MTLQQLEYLVTIEQEGSIMQAANKLGKAQPTLTMQLRLLKEELGVELYKREGNAAVLTSAGKQIAVQAKIVLKEADIIKDVVMNIKKGINTDARKPLITKKPELQRQSRLQKKAVKELDTAMAELLERFDKLKKVF